jgi:hypothetical protein
MWLETRQVRPLRKESHDPPTCTLASTKQINEGIVSLLSAELVNFSRTRLHPGKSERRDHVGVGACGAMPGLDTTRGYGASVGSRRNAGLGSRLRVLPKAHLGRGVGARLGVARFHRPIGRGARIGPLTFEANFPANLGGFVTLGRETGTASLPCPSSHPTTTSRASGAGA